MFELIERQRLPTVFFAEGGGGRPGDTDAPGVSGLDVMAFHLWGRLSGVAPRVGVTNGRCFAGNAAILGCCDLVIATEGSNIGMGGPAMIEGGGLGVVAPEEIGPLDVQVANGVVDVAVADEAEAVAVAKQFLSYFGPRRTGWTCDDQSLLRSIVPEQRTRIYDIREVITGLADLDSVLELRPRLRAGNDHVTDPRRGAIGRGRGEQPGTPGRRDRIGRCRQGRPIHAALRRVRCSHPLPL